MRLDLSSWFLSLGPERDALFVHVKGKASRGHYGRGPPGKTDHTLYLYPSFYRHSWRRHALAKMAAPDESSRSLSGRAKGPARDDGRQGGVQAAHHARWGSIFSLQVRPTLLIGWIYHYREMTTTPWEGAGLATLLGRVRWSLLTFTLDRLPLGFRPVMPSIGRQRV